MKKLIRKIVKDERGANLVEYIILLGVVALICIAAFSAFGGKIQDKVGEQAATVGSVNSGIGE